ncbi:uncharacterized protein [Clytia hemisphaerica]|uniref:BHLH domain-containing protein n=1 Tax=Clytia hemisphaerica TaxID=252671 RepID=A0A7M6DL93_9CNID
MSVVTASMRSNHVGGPQGKGSLSSPTIDYVANKKRKEEGYQGLPANGKSTNDLLADPSTSPSHQSHDKDIQGLNSCSTSQNPVTTSNQESVINHNGVPAMSNPNHYNSMGNGGTTAGQYPPTNGPVDSTGPLPNEIFELLNEFWRPNEMVAPSDTHMMNGKFTRRSPDGSLDDTVEEEKDGEDDITSLADADIGVDRTTQKRRYSRLSDGYERLKSVLPTVKDKRRVSKARILDEAINYIQRLESITSVLKREHEKRLSMLNGTNGFFPDYTVQPYMRSIFQKQMYPTGSNSKMSNYSKMNSPTSTVPKSPRMKQYNQSSYSSPSSMSVSAGSTGGNGSANMTGGGALDYNYNNIGSTYNTASSMYNQQPTNGGSDPNQMLNGDSSPINNASPYSACSLSPGSTPTTYQNGSTSSVVNNSWPYQGAGMSYNDASSQLASSYNPNRQSPNSTYNTSNPYSSLNSGMWGTMGSTGGGVADQSSHMAQNAAATAEHSMKVA